jgi:glycosyl transferase family 25
VNRARQKEFDIVVISLRSSAERRRHAARQLDAAPFPWSFQDAVNGAALATAPEEYDRRKRLRFFGYEMLPGQIGCFLSHRQAWKQCVERQKLTLILEDDFQFRQGLDEVLPVVCDNLSTFDILRLQGLREDWKYKVLKDHGRNKLVKHDHDPFGSTAYFIKPESARVLLEKSRRFHSPVDDFFGHDWVHRLHVLSILPYPVKPSGEPSTISPLEGLEAKLGAARKWQTKIHKLPRSIEKRFYRMFLRKSLPVQR